MSKLVKIRFGTSGWRAIMADTFTFKNVCLVSQAIADHLKSKSSSPKVIIGYDTRFMSGNFAKICAQVLAANNIKVLLADRDTPTPAIAFHIIAKSLDGGINFTASHNPPEYNGIKFSPRYGGPAPKEVTTAIEKRISFLQKNPGSIKKGVMDERFIEIFDPRKDYLKRLKKIIDISVIKKANLKVGIDCMFGTSRDYIDLILKDLCKEIKVFKDYLNPLFGGFPPEPDKPYIKELISHVKNSKFHLGVSCDGDADRFGIVDKDGVFLTPNEVITLLFYYLLKTRPKAKKVARTLSTTHMIDAIAAKEGIEVIETPVGFKYLGEALNAGDCIIGGEESGGLSIQGHVPEKDGILACLLVVEMVARQKKSLRSILSSLHKKYGYFVSDRLNLHLTQVQKDILLRRIGKLAKSNKFGDFKIVSKNLTDGYKFILNDDCWVMFRPSGTEPVLRCYFETTSDKKMLYLKRLIKEFTSC
ncbi:MAG: phosphoglucomutase/phosphomannomutase family protein [Candidatus Omnitrophica bacterium]|nr:phosphoglucomutase/phosphomannomutase family protein [Candidatus Omnitrophota bacterium]